MGGWDKAPEYGGNGRWSTVLGVIALVGVSFALVNCAQESAKAKAEAEPTVVASAPAQDIVGAASVIDGDTIEIHDQRIRLDGIDSPEEGKRCGDVNIYQSAANALSSAIGGATVHCTISDDPDSYGRQVAQCRVGDTDLNAAMVAQGMARDWPRYSSGEYADEEATARAAGSGVWSANCGPDLWGDRNYE